MSAMSISTVQEKVIDLCPAPRRFLRVRTVLLGSILFLSFVWTILLCVAVFNFWTIMGVVEQTLISIILFVEFTTIVLVPFLLAQEFRMWLDAARCLFLFTSHFGMAVWFACKSPSFDCPSASDERTVCDFLITFITIASWVVPALVILYACGLAYLHYRLSKATSTTTYDTTTIRVDVEKYQEGQPVQSSHRPSTSSSGYAVWRNTVT